MQTKTKLLPSPLTRPASLPQSWAQLIMVLFLLLLTSWQSVQAQILQDKWITTPKGCQVLDPYYKPGVRMEWQGSCLEGKAHGKGVLKKYVNDTLESTYEGNYEKGIRQGKGKFTHMDGSVKEGNFVNGQLIGYGIQTEENGTRYEGQFINYRFHGQGKLIFANGDKMEGFFVSDHLYDGKFITVAGKVTTVAQGQFTEDAYTPKASGYRPKLNEPVIEYFDSSWNRCLQKDASYYRMITYEQPNKPKGKVKDYYLSGSLQSVFTLVYADYADEGKNFHEGEALYYYTNGKLSRRAFYLNNKLDSTDTRWDEEGRKLREVHYSGDVRHGLYTTWYPSGKIYSQGHYTNGKLDNGRYTEYDEDGSASLVYNETFRNHKSDWESETESSQSFIGEEDDVVFLNNDASVTASRYINIPTNRKHDFSIETRVISKGKEKGNYGGMLFGYKDRNNYYEFLISEKGAFAIGGAYEGIRIPIKSWTAHNAVKNARDKDGYGIYVLKVMRLDNKYYFSINGTLVATEEIRELKGNNIGFTYAGKGLAMLTRLMVREFLPQEETEAKTEDDRETHSDFKKAAAEQEDWKGNGSGFFIDPSGFIATNYHVIKDARAIQVEYMDNGTKKAYRAKVVKSDKTNDLAVIKINDPSFKPLQALPYNISPEPKDVGSYVFALGYPMALSVMGEEIKFTDGTISARTGFKGNPGTYQISVPIQPGNSGCPLFDNGGNLVAIVVASLRKGVSENVNYAIKASYLTSLVANLPEKINLPRQSAIAAKPITEKIKVLSGFIPIIKIK